MRKTLKHRNPAAKALRTTPGAESVCDTRPKVVRNRRAYSRKGRRPLEG